MSDTENASRPGPDPTEPEVAPGNGAADQPGDRAAAPERPDFEDLDQPSGDGAEDGLAGADADAAEPYTLDVPADAGLLAELDRLKEENAALKDRALRAMAETENIRRRAQKEKEDTAKFAVSSFARDVLTVADNLARAVEAMPSDKADDPVFGNMREGISAVERELHGLFERHGIVRIEAMGQKFDPNYHQAMFEVPTAEQNPGTVVQVIQSGYVLHGRLLRPAMVGVAKGEPAQKVDTEA